jgi:uncharacterized protein YegL
MNENYKLLISFVFDNSFATAGQKLNNFSAAFVSFAQKIEAENLGEHIEFSLTVFGQDESEAVKKFGSNAIQTVKPNGMPFLNEAILSALRDMQARKRKLQKQAFDTHKPWFFIFSDGHSLDDLAPAAEKLREMDAAKSVLYMPFMTGGNAVTDKLEAINRFKRVLRLRDLQGDAFFNWVLKCAKLRLETQPNKNIRFEKADIEEFAIL